MSKNVSNVFWGKFFENFFASVPWRVESLKWFQKIKKIEKFQKFPKSFPKVSKRVLNMFWGNFFEKFFLPSVPRRVESSKCFKKFSKFKKRPKSFPVCPNVFWTCFGVIFLKNFFVQCSKECRVFEMFLKNQKFFKTPKMPKIVPKSVEKRFERVLGYFFREFFLPSVPRRVESSKCFKKKFQNSKNAQNRSQIVQTCFEHVLGYFFRKFFCTVIHGGSSLWNVFK